MHAHHRTTVDVIFQLPHGIRQIRLDFEVAEEAIALLQRFALPDAHKAETESCMSSVMPEQEKRCGVSY